MDNKLDTTPFLLVGIFILATFFLSCTKKPSQAFNEPGKDGRQPAANNVYTTPHGFKVQFEPATVAPQKK
jgi:hypothetical protein